MSIARDRRQTERGKTRGHQRRIIPSTQKPITRCQSAKSIRRDRIREKRLERMTTPPVKA